MITRDDLKYKVKTIKLGSEYTETITYSELREKIKAAITEGGKDYGHCVFGRDLFIDWEVSI